MLEKHELLQFNFRGKCIMAMEGMGSAMLNMWALQNTNGKKMTIVRKVDSKEIVCVVQGNGKDFPNIFKTKEEIDKLGLVIGEVM